MLRPRSCQDCQRPIGMSASVRPARCSACRLARSPLPVETRPCTGCAIPIRANSIYIRCEVCRQASRLNNSHGLPSPPDIHRCWECGNSFAARTGVSRCFPCRSRRANVVQPPTDFSQSATASFNPLLNSLRQPNTRKRKVQTYHLSSTPLTQNVPDNDRLQSVIRGAIDFLHQEYESRLQASNQFPPDISPSHIRSSVACYEGHMSIQSQEGICSSCGRLVPLGDIHRLHNEDHLLQPLQGHLDSCGWSNGSWSLCSQCHSALLRQSVPKFAATNHVNVTLCQHYPAALDDLTLTEECLIAKSHPIGVVLKLRPAGQSAPANYHAIRGHFIIIPQNPGPLLQILPSPELQFTELIKVLWLGNRPPTDSDLQPFLVVRKHKVLAALQYLVRHNPLYREVTVNHSAVNDWPDDFIPSDLQQHVICLRETDHHERAGYTVDLEDRNYEKRELPLKWGLKRKVSTQPNLDALSEELLYKTGPSQSHANNRSKSYNIDRTLTSPHRYPKRTRHLVDRFIPVA
jgi:hypothetical protein